MNMRTNVVRLADATHLGLPAVLDVIGDIDYGVRYAEDLREAVLRDHRDNHAEVSPRFCTEACQLAAEDW